MKHSIPVTVDSKAILVKHIMKSDKLVLRHDDIDRVKKIGKGCFGDVYEGTLLTTGERIAIKKCRANAFENAEEFLSREAETLKQYDHQNVVKLIGVCTEKYPIYVVMEFMSGGTFLDFLCKLGVHQPKAKLCKMCIDVCSGMSYLESKKYVHRYLTAQNCLIGENDIVKISIFRISRVVQLEEGEIYVDQSMVRPIPIEWTAPEVSIGVQNNTLRRDYYLWYNFRLVCLFCVLNNCCFSHKYAKRRAHNTCMHFYLPCI